MPYIKQTRREFLNRQKLDKLAGSVGNIGEINYIITKLLNDYLNSFSVPYSYQDLNEVIGVLECAKLEFYRILVASYEEIKMVENGPVCI